MRRARDASFVEGQCAPNSARFTRPFLSHETLREASPSRRLQHGSTNRQRPGPNHRQRGRYNRTRRTTGSSGVLTPHHIEWDILSYDATGAKLLDGNARD